MKGEEEINKLTEKIIGFAIDVHKTLGPGFVERLNFTEQAVIKVKYKGEELGNQRVDFAIEDEVIVEVKSVAKIISLFELQLLSYLKTSGKKVGLILNFGTKRLEIKRMVNRL